MTVELQQILNQARILRGSVDPLERERAELLERQVDLQEQNTALKARKVSLGALYEPRRAELCRRLTMTMDRLGRIRSAQRAAEEGRVDRERVLFAFAFLDSARSLLPVETYRAIRDAAREIVGQGEDADDCG